MADLLLRFWCFVDEVFYGLVVVFEPVPEGIYFSHSLFYLTAKAQRRKGISEETGRFLLLVPRFLPGNGPVREALAS